MTDNDRAYYKKEIKSRLTDWRYRHSVNVAAEAVRLAKKYGADPERAELAGLLHDITKDMSKKEQLAFMEEHGVTLSVYEQHAPKLWHAVTGAVYVERVLRVGDEDIWNAIRYHTTGRAGMSLLEKIVYVADCTSKERDYDGVERIRKAADVSLEAAMEEALAASLRDRLDDRTPMHPDTVAAYNELLLAKDNKTEKSDKKK